MSKTVAALLAACLALPAAAMAAPALTTPAPSMIRAPSARHFAAYMIGHDRAMVKLADLAERRATEPGVRHFAHTLWTDDQRAATRLDRVSRQTGIALPPQADGDVAPDLARLQKLQGRSFDNAFLQIAVRRLLRARRDYRIEQAATNGQISKLAGDDLPMIHKHLSSALKRLPAGERPRGM